VPPGCCAVERRHQPRRGALVHFADLLILPIINIYRKYYGLKMTTVITGVFYTARVAAGYAVELTFGLNGLTPDRASARMPEAGITSMPEGAPVSRCAHHVARSPNARTLSS
jgi:hypothetical protein